MVKKAVITKLANIDDKITLVQNVERTVNSVAGTAEETNFQDLYRAVVKQRFISHFLKGKQIVPDEEVKNRAQEFIYGLFSGANLNSSNGAYYQAPDVEAINMLREVEPNIKKYLDTHTYSPMNQGVIDKNIARIMALSDKYDSVLASKDTKNYPNITDFYTKVAMSGMAMFFRNNNGYKGNTAGITISLEYSSKTVIFQGLGDDGKIIRRSYKGTSNKDVINLLNKAIKENDLVGFSGVSKLVSEVFSMRLTTK